MKVIIAARLSKKVAGLAQGSIESQDEDAREWARDEGHEVVATVPDHASGTKAMAQRKNLRPWVTQPELMAKYQGIVAAKQDRLSRADWRDEAELRIWAETNHKTLFIVDRDLRWPPRDDANHDDDVSRWNDGAEAAHREWNATSRRYKRMQKLRVTNNQLTGKAPYGYRIQGIECRESPCRCYERKIDDHKTLVIYKPEAKIVREAARRYLDAGESIEKICADFNARNVPSPMWRGQPGKHWYVKTLAELLKSPSIAGRRMNAEGKTILRYEGIISWQDHDLIVARMDSRANRAGISSANAFMLTGIIEDEAGHPMYGVSHRKRWHYYRCRHCGSAIPLDRADAEVDRRIRMWYGQSYAMHLQTIPAENHYNRIDELRQDRAELDEEIDRASDPEPYIAKRDEITAEIRRLIKLDTESSKEDRVEWVISSKTVAQEWDELDNAGRRDWLKSRQWKVIAHHDGTIEVIPGPMHGPTIGGIEVPVIRY